MGKVRIAAYILVILMVGLGGLEPPTSPLSGARSSHLSYRPIETRQQHFLLYSTCQILAIRLLPNCHFCVPLQTLFRISPSCAVNRRRPDWQSCREKRSSPLLPTT